MRGGGERECRRRLEKYLILIFQRRRSGIHSCGSLSLSASLKLVVVELFYYRFGERKRETERASEKY